MHIHTNYTQIYKDASQQWYIYTCAHIYIYIYIYIYIFNLLVWIDEWKDIRKWHVLQDTVDFSNVTSMDKSAGEKMAC